MKHPYHLILSTVALSSALAFAQQKDNQVEATATSPTPAVVKDAPAEAQANVKADAQANTQADVKAAKVEQAKPAGADVQAPKTEQVKAAEPEKIPAAKVMVKTEISGTVHGMLLAENSPYLVTGDLTVEENQALFIQPGVTLLFKPGTRLYVNKGQLMVSGSDAAPVIFRSENATPNAGDWKGIFLTGMDQFNLRGVHISDAQVGIAIEQGKLDLQSSKIENTASRGLYVRDGEATIMDCKFIANKGVSLHAGNYATTHVTNTDFSHNNIALLNSELANTTVLGSHFKGNDFGVVGKENNSFYFHETSVSENKVGAAGMDILDPSVIASVSKNDNDFGSSPKALLSEIPSNPEIPGIESRPFNPSDKIGVLNREADEKAQDKKSWTVLGNFMSGGSYHYVRTRKKMSKKDELIGDDIIRRGDYYKNTFQVPGFQSEASAYLYMQSADGKSIEFNADLTMDNWNKFYPNPVTLTYKDNFSTAILGDIQKVGGDIYMSGLPVFGIDYTLALLRNNADKPLFEVNGFFGEARRSLVPGDRHPEIYKDYIEDGTAQAQRLTYGGSFKWAPVRRFDAKFGAIYANDEIDDPLFRDGGSKTTTTADPMIEAFTMYADGNWLFFPGDIELNGQIAVGRADTADVYRERAINEVFSEAGITVGSYSTLRKLMQNTSKINTLSHDELAEIFGENSALRDSEMKDSLRTLIRNAKDVQKESEDDRDDDRVLGENWGSQNFALSASLNWSINKTYISGNLKYIGEDFYSAGSDDQLSDTRHFDALLEQDIFDFWTFAVGYELDIENAAKGSKTNLLGLGEGTHWGLFPETDSHWFEEHEQDIDRTKYIQNINTKQTFDIGKNLTLTAGYKFQYEKQYRQYQLHGDYVLEDGIYNDSWFNARKGRTTEAIVLDGDTTLVDSARWAEYNSLSTEEYLASKFQERIFKHTINAGVSFKAFKTTFKADGVWTLRADGSVFLKDSLVQDMDLNDTTWAKLGYYYGGSNYFEHRYPVSITTALDRIQNRFFVTPRFKSYKRDDMEETEISVGDNFEISFLNKFLVLGLDAQFRYMLTEWVEGSKDCDESETDILGDVNLRVNHSKHFFSEWDLGFGAYKRPDDLSSEYTDIYGGVRLNYVF